MLSFSNLLVTLNSTISNLSSSNLYIDSQLLFSPYCIALTYLTIMLVAILCGVTTVSMFAFSIMPSKFIWFTLIITFTSASRFITSDTFKISDLLGDAGWIAELVSGIIQVDTFSLGGFEIGFLAVFIGILIWTGAFYLVELGEPKDAPAKKKK